MYTQISIYLYTATCIFISNEIDDIRLLESKEVKVLLMFGHFQDFLLYFFKLKTKKKKYFENKTQIFITNSKNKMFSETNFLKINNIFN